MKFYSLCSYPHGCATVAFLWASCAGAVASTMYAVASCHFVVVKFDSTRGSFEEMFEQTKAAGSVLSLEQIGAGLFSWTTSDSTESVCTGYSELARGFILDGIMEASRFMGVVVVLFGLVVLIWVSMLTCVRLLQWQKCMMQILVALLVLLTCLIFLIKQSALCHEIGTTTTKCSLDQGGLVNIAGAILWFVAFCIVTVFVKIVPPKRKTSSRQVVPRTVTSKTQSQSSLQARKQGSSKRVDSEDEELAAVAASAAAAEAAHKSSSLGDAATDEDDSLDDSLEQGYDQEQQQQQSKQQRQQAPKEGSIEVYIGKFLDTIESLVE